MTATIRIKHWCRIEYEQLIELGIFRGEERLELLGGALLVRELRSDRHALTIELCHDALRGALGPDWRIRVRSRWRSTTNQNLSPICRWSVVDLVKSATDPFHLVPR